MGLHARAVRLDGRQTVETAGRDGQEPVERTGTDGQESVETAGRDGQEAVERAGTDGQEAVEMIGAAGGGWGRWKTPGLEGHSLDQPRGDEADQARGRKGQHPRRDDVAGNSPAHR